MDICKYTEIRQTTLQQGSLTERTVMGQAGLHLALYPYVTISTIYIMIRRRMVRYPI